MRSKTQKTQDIRQSEELLEQAQSLVLVDFFKTPANEMNALRRTLEQTKATLKVIRKTLLALVMKKHNIPLDVTGLRGQVGIVFAPGQITEPASVIARFVREKGKSLEAFVMVAGCDVKTQSIYSAVEMTVIGNLPPRDVLLGQLAWTIIAPLRSLAYVLQKVAEQRQS
jgi:large subunit ribosomal protein L10